MVHSAITAQLAVLFTLVAGRCLHDEVQGWVAGATAVRYSRERGMGRSDGGTPLASPRPIRIAAFYSSVPDMVLRREEKRRLNDSVQQAIGRLAQLLAVIPVVDNLLLSRDIERFCRSVWRNSSLPNFNKCGQMNLNYQTEICLDVVIPDDHLAGFSVWTARGSEPVLVREDGTGVPNADFILYIKAANTLKCRREPAVIAYAASCKVDQFGRPIAGSITFCHAQLRGSTFQHERTTLTTIHELLHALGFSKHLYNSWLECSPGSPLGRVCSPRGSVTNTDHGTVRIFTPTVVAQMQLHLHSRSAGLGAPLENWLQAGSPSSHWEARVLQGSIMTSSLGSAPHTFIDPITLAALADTGWYSVQYASTQPLVWGQGQGENFGHIDSCHENSSQYFCSGSGLGCHYLHLDKATCLTDDLLDGCRMFKPLANGSECWRAANSRTVDNLTATGEIFGHNSRCFVSNLSALGSPLGAREGRCYLHRCRVSGHLEVKVQGSDWLPCRSGDSIQVLGYRGRLSCPAGVLCWGGAKDPDRPASTSDPGRTPGVSPTHGPCGERVTRRGPGPWVTLQLRLTGTPSCCPLEDGEEGAAQDLAETTGIPRALLSPPRGCGPQHLCLELWEFECPGPSALQLLQRRLDVRPLVLRIHGHNCTVLGARSGSWSWERPAEAPDPPDTVKVAAVCGTLAGLLASGALATGIAHTLRRGRARVHAGPAARGSTVQTQGEGDAGKGQV